MRVAVRNAAVSEREVFGCRSDARLLFAVREDQRLINAVACDATWFERPDGRINGEGHLRWPAVAGGAVKSQDEARQRQ